MCAISVSLLFLAAADWVSGFICLLKQHHELSCSRLLGVADEEPAGALSRTLAIPNETGTFDLMAFEKGWFLNSQQALHTY